MYPVSDEKLNSLNLHYSVESGNGDAWTLSVTLSDVIIATELYLLYLRKENRYSVCLAAQTEQMNGAYSDQFERHGVESDVTQPKN